MAKGFNVTGVPLCCVCAEWYAQESGYPNLFFQINPIVNMDDKKRCVCGRLPGASDCLRAADNIAAMIENSTINDTTACNAIRDCLSVALNDKELAENITKIIRATGR